MSPSFAPASISAAITSVYAVIASWTPWIVVSRSATICEIDTFMTLLSSTITNCAAAKIAMGRPRPDRASSPWAAGWLTAFMGGKRPLFRNTYAHAASRAENRPLWAPASGDRAVRGRAGHRPAERRPAGGRDRARRRHARARLPHGRPLAAPHASGGGIRRGGARRGDRA